MGMTTLQNTLAAHGLTVHGVLNFEAVAAPDLAMARPVKSIALIGNAGSTIWPHFQRWLRAVSASSSSASRSLSDPLDAWSKEVIGGIATAHGGRAVLPSDKPYQPFQQWAMAATGMKPSPLGILIHPVYGLWHAYRGAIVIHEITLSQKFDVLNQSAEKLSHPCDSCLLKPCLSACPVSAFSNGKYDVESCRSHVKSTAGQACLTGGCLARRACPVGKEFEYVPEQMEFHMNTFVK